MAVSHEVALRDELLRSRDHDIATLTIALREARAEIERLRAVLTAITKVPRDDWEFREGYPTPKWRLLAIDAITVEHSAPPEGDNDPNGNRDLAREIDGA